MSTTLTREQAEAALESVKKQFADVIGAGYAEPELREDGGIWTNAPYSIAWEEGPYQWTYMCPEGGHDEEMSSLMEKSVSRDPAPDWPEGVFAEAQNHVVLCLYGREYL